MRLQFNVKRQHVVLVMALLGLIGIVTGAIPLSIVSNYQMPKPLFYGVYYNGVFYTPTQCYDASLCTFDTSMEFDPDEPYKGMGNLAGEETTIFIPEQATINSIPEWVPRAMTSDLPYIKNPVRVFEWKIEKEDGTIEYYRMEEWVLKYFVSISYEWDSNDEAGLYTFFPKDVRYHNAEVWIRINLNDKTWYFKNADNVFFGIGKIVVNSVEFSNKKYEGGEETISPVNVIRVNPSSEGSVLPLYLKPRDVDYRVKDMIKYKGAELNPNVFAKTVYTRIILEDFGSRIAHPGLFHYEAYGDVVTYAFDVHVFVVGEWKVKDIQELPDDYGRESRFQETNFFDFLELGTWSKIMLPLLTILIILVLLAIFMPGFLTFLNSIFSLIGRHVKKRGEK